MINCKRELYALKDVYLMIIKSDPSKINVNHSHFLFATNLSAFRRAIHDSIGRGDLFIY